MIDKKVIKNRFSNRLNTYETESIIQKQVAEKLVNTLLEFGLSEFGTILEIGAGTGHLSKMIEEKLTFDDLIINDLSAKSEHFLREKISHPFTFIEGDAEEIELPSFISAIFSSSTLQWFEDIPGFLSKATSSLSPKGFMVLSTYGPDNFKEVKAITGRGLHYNTSETLKEMISEEYNIIYAKDWNIEMEFDSAFDAFKHIKKTGVNAVHNEIIQSSAMKRHIQTYEDNYRRDNKVILTYNPIIIIAQKS